MKIPVYKPFLPEKSLAHAHRAIDSGWLSRGKYNEMVSELLQDLLHVKHVLLTSSGTTAMHLVAMSLSHRKPHITRVLMPDNVYVAAWNAFFHRFVIQPIPADIYTWNFNLKRLGSELEESNPNNTAVCVVHNLSNIVNVPDLATRHSEFTFVEDACEGFLGMYSGKPVGSASLASAISFFGNKNITSGEGGAFVTDDSELYEFAFDTHGQGQSHNKRFVHDILGYNYRMTNVQAALLLGQLENLSEMRERKQQVFDLYRKYLAGCDKVLLQKPDEDTDPANWMFAVRIPGALYDDMEGFFVERMVEVRPMFAPIGWHRHLSHIVCDDSVSSKLRRECVVLPSYCELTEQDVKQVVSVLFDYLKEIG